MTMPENSYMKLLSSNNKNTFCTYIFSIVKLFVFFGLGVSLLFGAFQFVRRNSFDGFVDGIMVGIVGTLIAVPILILLDIFNKVRCYLKYRTIDFGVNQERRFIVKDDYASAFNKLCEVLSRREKIDICNRNMESGIIDAVAKPSWKSFGEKITIRLFESSKDKETTVVLTSKPRISLTMLDYCRNFENVEMLINDIRMLM